MGKLICTFTDIYKMKTIQDIPYSLPIGKSKEWYIEFYTVACHILKDKYKERYDVCYRKLMELERGEDNETRSNHV